MAELMDKHWSEIWSIFSDVVVASFCYAVCRSLIKFLTWRHLSNVLFDVHLVRKLTHISVGLTVMLCWPLFSSSVLGRVIAGLIPGFCFEGFVNSRTFRHIKLLERYRDTRDLLKAALGYALMFAFATIFHWRSPIAIAAICNLCAGDGVADLVGRRFGSWKLPYNKNKSYVGSIGMAIAGFLASILFMYYFSWLGYIQESPNMVLGFLILSIVSAVVESHPLSTILDDNLTVPVASILIGTLVL